MRCLYCGEPLSLLRKLTGKAEFCSEAHREAYQDEFNNLALQRLASQPKLQKRVIIEPDPPAKSDSSKDSASEAVSDDLLLDDLEDLAPIFDSPIFNPSAYDPPPYEPPVSVTAAATEEPPPPPLWGSVEDTSLRPFGEEPPSYSFPLWLEDYPRACLMTNGLFASTFDGAVPYGTYVDLPELMDDDCDSGGTAVEPSFAAIAPVGSIAWTYEPSASQLAISNNLAPLAMDLSLGYDEAAFAEPTCTLAIPAHHRWTGGAPVSLRYAPSLPEAHTALAPGIDPSASVVGRLEVDTVAFDAQPEPWCLPAMPLSDLAWTAPRQLTLDGLADLVHSGSPTALCGQQESMPESPGCESFDAECSVFAPQLDLDLNQTVSAAGLVGLELESGDGAAASAEGAIIPFGQGTQPALLAPRVVPETNVEVSPAGLRPLEFTPVNAVAPDALTGISQHNLPWENGHPVPAAVQYSTPDRGLALAGANGIPASAALSGHLETGSGDWAPFAFGFQTAPQTFKHDAYSPRSVERLESLTAGLRAIALPADTPEAVLKADDLPALAPSPWLPVPLAILRPTPVAVTPLNRVRVKDFTWPAFAAGSESLFTPDQPFRFHELPFPSRGTTDIAVGDALESKIMEGLLLRFADDRFEAILHPAVEPQVVETWLAEDSVTPGTPSNGRAPSAGPFRSPAPTLETYTPPAAPQLGATPVSNPPAREPAAIKPPVTKPPVIKPSDPPASWQQAARAMHEGEQQIPHEPQAATPLSAPSAPPPAPALPSATPPAEPEAKPVNAVPIINEPKTGMEVSRVPAPELPVPAKPRDTVENTGQSRTPASDQPQFEWRREQPQQAPPPPGASTVSVNTTITVDGNSEGVVVENAIRVSLGGNKKKKVDAVERFTEGEDIDDTRIQMAAPEGLPDFTAEEPELRAVLQHITPLAESIQWPKFSVTPMRRRIAFGPPNRGFFGGPNGQSSTKTPPPEAKPLPPKKSVGFLFKKLTNS